MMRSWKSVASSGLAMSMTLALAGVLSVPVWAQVQNGSVAVAPPQAGSQQAGPPIGMLNYVEEQVSLGGQALTEKSAGSVEVRAGQTLATQNGRAELLLTPGVLMRLDNNSAVLMNTPGIPDTEMAVTGGRAMIEADQVLPANHIIVHMGPAAVQVEKNGLYDFDAAHAQVRVFDGRAKVDLAGKGYTVQGGHQFDLNAVNPKARGFDKKADEDAFYRWASLRSSYLAEANVDAARGYANGYYGSGYAYPNYAAFDYGYGPGWFWDPYFSAYTWLPWDGAFYSPFGWGFYSPGFVYAAPFYGFGGGFHRFGPGYRATVAPHPGGATHIAGGGGFSPGFGARPSGGGFVRSGSQGGGFRSGGFQGGGGGFHGGGGFQGGGGFHGGGGRR